MGNILAGQILPVLLGQLLRLLTPELVRELADKLLNVMEETIRKSPNKIDDAFLQVIVIVRAAFGVEPGQG